MPRLFSTGLLLTLLGATSGAFVVTEGLKLERSPITKVFVTKVFSPTCECDTDSALVAFRLRKSDRLTLSILDNDNRLVRTLVGPVVHKKGEVTASWDGRDEDAAVVRDGVYRVRVHLRHRTILMPNAIHLDTTPPVVRLRHVGPRVLEPGRRLKVRYIVNEPAQVLVFLNGRRVVLGKSTRLKWKVEWQAHGRPGKYRVTVAARDIAGNLSDAAGPVTVVIPLRVQTRRVRVGAGARFPVHVVGDGRAYHWRLGRSSGWASGRTFVARAPRQAGRYRLVIRQDRIAHVAAVVVKPKQ